MNKSYCKRAFDHIYCDNKGRYRLCCHAFPFEDKPLFNYNVITPFDYFLSTEMDEIRSRMFNGEDIPECNLCISIEKRGGISYREFNKIQTEPGNIQTKLRMFGSHCNLSCYMCMPFNSSGRRKELSQLKNKYFFSGPNRPIKKEPYEKAVKNILDNIDKISTILLTGGEPFLLPRMWSFLNKISDEDASRIELSIDTNLTDLDYTRFTSDIVLRFKRVLLAVSCDHYGDKLAWIRYPMDVKKFESNLKLYREWINHLCCCASILNINDKNEIIKYYKDNFDIELKFASLVYYPPFLSIRNSNNKDTIIKNWQAWVGDTSTGMLTSDPLIDELKREPEQKNLIKQYLSELNAVRKIDITKLWPDLDDL